MTDRFLPKGFLLYDRFEILEVLGHGGFGAVYLARDHSRGDKCVVKELSPANSVRSDNLVLHFPAETEGSSSRLRQRFMEEASLSNKLRAPGLLHVRATFTDLGTAYFVSDYLEGCQSLQALLESHRKLPASDAHRMLTELLITLEAIHGEGVIHRDIKPSNILISKSGTPYLIDFGAAREWSADSSQTHTILYTPGFAPPEQLSERARRGPATDLYSLCATFFLAVTGEMPVGAPDRAAGQPYVSVHDLEPSTPKELAQTIDYGLRLTYAERPQSASVLLNVLLGEQVAEQADDALAEFDDTARRLAEFGFVRRQCPACGGVLEEPKPLKLKQCPVCQLGTIRVRKLNDRLCPHCKAAPLNEISNHDPLAICPMCAEGILNSKKRGFFDKSRDLSCPECESLFQVEGQNLTLVVNQGKELPEEQRRTMPASRWREESGRAATVWACTGCGAQLDELTDGRRKLVVPHRTHRFEVLFPDEWARVAAGLLPNAGNAECDSCGSDYFVEGESVTLMTLERDPLHFGEKYLGRRLTFENLRWLGIGKVSPNDGLVCIDCGTELDFDGNYLRLVQSPNTRLCNHAQEPHTMEDWHRISHRLPMVHEEETFERDFDTALIEAYEAGQIMFDGRRGPDVIWSGPAERFEIDDEGHWTSSGKFTLEISFEQIELRARLRKWRFPFDALTQIQVDSTIPLDENGAQDRRLLLTLSGERTPLALEIESVEFTADLKSGERTVVLTAKELQNRLQYELELRRTNP